MHRLYGLAATTLALIAGAPPAAEAATFLKVGENATCAEAGCFSGAGRYTQTFLANAFSGPTSISSLTLFKGLMGDLQSKVVKVSFQLADGTELGDWGGFMVAALAGDVVTLKGKAFEWNPEMGDLIVSFKADLAEKGAGGFGGFGGGGFGGGGGFRSSPAFESSPGSDGDDSPAPPFALARTAFEPNAAALSAAPEPAAWVLAIAGFAAIGGAARRNRRHLAVS